MKALSSENIFSIIGKNVCHSVASNSKAYSPILPEIELVRDYMPVLVTSKFDEEISFAALFSSLKGK